MKKYNVAIVGATGAVGRQMLKTLQARKFPVKNLILYASERSKGKYLYFNRKKIPVKVLKDENFSGIDFALFSAGATISKEFTPKFIKYGAKVVDNSSAWRMEQAIPLVVPEVNLHKITDKTPLIANPNCSTIQMCVVLKPIMDNFGLKRVIVATYQAVSGAGGRAIQDLENQIKAWYEHKKIPQPKKLPQQIAFNVIPHIDVFTENAYTKEEMKMINETKKILDNYALKISSTTVRVPVFRGHSEAVWIETEKSTTPDKVRNILQKSQGIKVMDDPSKNLYPMPITAANKYLTYVGRIRKDLSCDNGIVLWIVSDNLLKGAALNAVQILEFLAKKNK